MYVCVPHMWFCPVFHGARHVPSTTGVGRFSRVHVQPVHGSVYVRVRRTWFCPVFHRARHVPSATGVGRFFHVSTYSPFTGPCKGPCTSVCLVRGFAQFSMARVTFRP